MYISINKYIHDIETHYHIYKSPSCYLDETWQAQGCGLNEQLRSTTSSQLGMVFQSMSVYESHSCCKGCRSQALNIGCFTCRFLAVQKKTTVTTLGLAPTSPKTNQNKKNTHTQCEKHTCDIQKIPFKTNILLVWCTCHHNLWEQFQQTFGSWQGRGVQPCAP